MAHLAARDLLAGLPRQLPPGRAGETAVAARLELSGEEGGGWDLAIGGGAVAVISGGAGPAPAAVIRMPAASFAEMMQGRVDPRALQGAGLLAVEGQTAVLTGLVSILRRAGGSTATGRISGGMTGRRRIMAALRGEEVDRIPFAPLIDNYMLLDAPAEIPRHPIEAARSLGVDIILRHVPILQWSSLGFMGGLGSFRPPVTFCVENRGDAVVETIGTPWGKLTGVSAFTSSAGWIPHPLKHAVETEEELNLFRRALDYLEPGDLSPAHEGFRVADQAVGEDGIATPSLNNSPLLHFLETVSGLTHAYYLMHDHPALVDEILAILAANYLKAAEAMAQSPAQVVIAYENTSTTLVSPALYRRYCLPYLDACADILHRAGKIHLVHMCGKLANLRPEIAGGRFDGVVDIAPAPTGDLPLDEAAAAWPGKAILGGIDATSFVSCDRAGLEAETARLIGRVKHRRGILLGSGDSVPRGFVLDNVRLIQRLVETVGAY